MYVFHSYFINIQSMIEFIVPKEQILINLKTKLETAGLNDCAMILRFKFRLYL